MSRWAYEANWMRLADAVQFAIAHTGISKNDAKNVICQGIAEGTIGIRCKLRKHATRPMTSTDILQGKAFQIPDAIQRSDLDWEGSRALTPWYVKRGCLFTARVLASGLDQAFQNRSVACLF